MSELGQHLLVCVINFVKLIKCVELARAING